MKALIHWLLFNDFSFVEHHKTFVVLYKGISEPLV